jgi:hypothetical protein
MFTFVSFLQKSKNIKGLRTEGITSFTDLSVHVFKSILQNFRLHYSMLTEVRYKSVAKMSVQYTAFRTRHTKRRF